MEDKRLMPQQRTMAPDAMDALLVRVADRDTRALAELYAATRDAVYSLALGFLRNADDAQDLTQDTFVRVWDAAGQYRSKGAPMAWLLTVARNLARMRLRQSGRSEALSEDEWNAIPSDRPVGLEDRLTLQTALAALDDAERQVVLLHASSGLKHREIAALLGLPLSTVLSKYQRALKKMRALLEGDDVE